MFPQKNRNTRFEIAFHGSASFVHRSPITRVWADTPDPDISFHNIENFDVNSLFSRNSSRNSSHALQTNWLAVIVLELVKTHAFRFSRNLYWYIICAVSTTIPRKASFRRMTSEGEVPQIMKNIGFILWALSTEITYTEFTVPRYETRLLRKHRIIKWKPEQLRIYLNVTFSADFLEDLQLLIPTMGAGCWLRN